MSGHRTLEESKRDRANIRWVHSVLSNKGIDGLHKEYLNQPEDQQEYIRWLVTQAVIELHDFLDGVEQEFCDITDVMGQITKE